MKQVANVILPWLQWILLRVWIEHLQMHLVRSWENKWKRFAFELVQRVMYREQWHILRLRELLLTVEVDLDLIKWMCLFTNNRLNDYSWPILFEIFSNRFGIWYFIRGWPRLVLCCIFWAVFFLFSKFFFRSCSFFSRSFCLSSISLLCSTYDDETKVKPSASWREWKNGSGFCDFFPFFSNP